VKRSQDLVQLARALDSRFIDDASVGGVAPAIDAPSGKVDTHVAFGEIRNPRAWPKAVPGHDTPRSWPRLPAQHGDHVALGIKVAGFCLRPQLPDFSAMNRRNNASHLSASAGYDDLHDETRDARSCSLRNLEIRTQ